MKKNIKLIMNIFLIIISILLMFIIIRNKISNNVSKPYVAVSEETNKIVLNKRVKFNFIDKTLLFLLMNVFVFSILHLLKKNKKFFSKYNFSYGFILSFLLFCLIVFVSNNFLLNIKQVNNPYNNYIISPKGIYEYETNKTLSGEKIVCNKKDTNSILVNKNSTIDIFNSKIYKYGDSKDLSYSKIYGINSAILIMKDSKLNISNSSINTSAIGASGLFSVLENSRINANSLIINTTSKESIGIVSSINSEIVGNNITIKTSSSSSPALSSIRDGILTIESSILKTTASDSPLISSSSIVNINDSIGDANASPAIYMTDNPIIKISNCKFNVTANKISEKKYDGAFVIYNDSNKYDYNGNSRINIYSSEINIKKQSKVYSKAPIFYIIDSNVVINLSDNTFSYGSNIFLNVKNTNKNKKLSVVLNSTKQEINGNIQLSKNVSLDINFKNTNFNGNINYDNNSNDISLNIDKNSNISLTDNIHVSIINDDDDTFDNIVSNGYTLYYDKTLNKKLNGKTIKLKDGGAIKPI